MQRRAAATYVAIFLIIGAASYSLIATGHEPGVTFPNEDPLSQGQTLTVDGRTYEIVAIEATMEESSGGGHGGGGGATLVRSGSLAWTNDSATYTQTWDNGSTVSFDGDQWDVVVESARGNPTEFTLREAIDRQAILANDTDADNETITRNGQEYVVVQDGEGGEATLVPADEYFPDPETRQFSEGDEVQYANNTTSVAAVENESVTLAWTSPRTNTIELADESTVALNGQEYLAYFPTNNSVILTQNFERYDAEQQDIENYHDHVNGLWGISILSGVVAMFLTMVAYLPSRY